MTAQGITIDPIQVNLTATINEPKNVLVRVKELPQIISGEGI